MSNVKIPAAYQLVTLGDVIINSIKKTLAKCADFLGAHNT